MSEFPPSIDLHVLPSCPWVADRIVKLGPLDHVEPPQILQVLKWDPALAITFLQKANATPFGKSWPVASLDRAFTLLDPMQLVFSVLSFSLRNDSGQKEPTPWDVLSRRSQLCGLIAERLSPDPAENSEIDPFLGGVLCRLDWLAQLDQAPIDATLQKRLLASGDAWKEWSSGNSLLQTLTLPESLKIAVRLLDAPEQSDPHALTRLLRTADTIAGGLTHTPKNGKPIHEALLQFDDSRFHSEESRRVFLQQILQEFPEATEEFSSHSLLRDANFELARLGRTLAESRDQLQKRAEVAEQSLHQYERKMVDLEHQALRDPLTGVYNRRFLLEALHKEVARCCRYGTPIGVLFVDVDNFKPLNDSLGHLAGDQVLRRVAETLGHVLRGADILARYGGEEFVILPNDPDEVGIHQLAERLRVAVESLVTTLDRHRIQVTVSVGCTMTVPSRNDLSIGPQLLAAADAAMYEAKERGKNQVLFHSLVKPEEKELVQQTVESSFSRWLVQNRVLSQDVMESALQEFSPDRLPLGELAVDTGALTEEEVHEILASQLGNESRFGMLAVEKQLLTSKQLARLLARQRENPVRLTQLLIQKHLLDESHAVELVRQYLEETAFVKDEHSTVN